tara:strand:- start:26416 stop:27474 length:1059 start_codon:yes stop_codon:yes gene_type:complete
LLSEEKEPSNRRRRRRPRQKSGNGAKHIPWATGEPEAMERALGRFHQDPPPMGIPKDIDPPPEISDLKWQTNAIAKSIQKKVGEIVIKPGEFGFLPEERVDDIRDEISQFPISIEQALSLRGALNQEKSVHSHGRLMRNSNQLRRRYDAGEGVLTLAQRFDAPPVNTFRAILTGRGWSKNRIKETLKDPKRMNKRDQNEFSKAEEADKVSSVNQSDTQSAAEVFEEILFSYFENLGIRFRKQDDLLKEQKESEGRAIVTPDLLLLDDVRINGVPCAWIDAKHFFGADLRFPRKKTQKQVDRYVNEYGQGAIVYRHGFTESLKIKGAILLDASPLDLTPLDEFHEKRSGGHHS